MKPQLRLLSFLLAIFLAGCAAPATTPQQSMPPEPQPEVTQSPAAPVTSMLSVKKGIPNPTGNIEELYLISGNLSDNPMEFDQTLVQLPQANANAAKSVKIFHFNDMHGNIMLKSAKGNTHVLAQMKKLVDDAKTSANDDTAILWVSAGDDHIGTALDELLGNSVDEFIMSAPYETYSVAGLDAAVPGNHEYDKMTQIFVKMVDENAAFPVINSNISNSQYNLPTSLAAVAVVKGLRLGIIGLTNPSEVKMKTELDKTIQSNDPLNALDALVPLLDPYCDAFVILSHLGYEASSRYTISAGDGAAAEHLANLTQKPGVVVSGHTHYAINNDGLEESNIKAGIPVLQAGQYGDYLGEVNFNISATPTYTARLHKIISGKATTDGTPFESEADYDVLFQTDIVDPIFRSLDAKLDTRMGYTENTPELSIEQTNIDRYIGECAFANYYNDGLVKRSDGFSTGKADFSVFNSTGLTGITPGIDITYRDIFNMFPYADTLLYTKVTGKQILEILTNNAARIVRPEELITGGGTLDPASFIERGFLHFSGGIRYTIVLGETNDLNTVKDVTLNGEPIEKVLDKEYNVIFSTYLAIGRGGWQGEPVGQGLPDTFIGWDIKSLCETSALDLGLSYRNEFMDYIRDDCNGVIGASTGVIKDDRVQVVGP